MHQFRSLTPVHPGNVGWTYLMAAAQSLGGELEELRHDFENWRNCDAGRTLGKAKETVVVSAREPKAEGI
jgi:hypothetical protein